ncbi:STAS domain-containing protein [Cytobacillus oceanisediminis]|uniref:RsbT co-antagonist protein RsbR n=1 Tax=Cytobacillus oceanisediminis TaxID=665099 RepID=A0A562JWV4_9BACI|nr:STAS domain-containing protein [Cytobacillus oceanisediminis]TWH87661.1 rsbT co-antagonist protein RsbR [Cytobacillus oceanisediminis]
MEPIQKVSAYLTQNAETLSEEIVAEIVSRFGFEIPKQEFDAAVSMYIEFMKFLGTMIASSEDQVPEGLVEWSKGNGEQAAAMGGKISDIVTRYPDTRIVFTDRLRNIGKEHGLTADEVITIVKKVNYMLDISVNETVFAFERHTQKLIKETQTQVNELSATIVPIQDSIAILPLIGSIDYERAQIIIEKAVPKVNQLGIENLIIDFSGTVNIDIEIAKHIFDIRNILLLTGVNTIATGVRPDLAKKAVTLGIDLSSLEVYSTVQQAIKSIK